MSEWNPQDSAAAKPPPPRPGGLEHLPAWEDVRSGATFQHRTLPSPKHPIHAFFHGLCLPYHLLRALFADKAARRRYLWVAILQAVAVLVLGWTLMDGGTQAADRSSRRGAVSSRKEPPVRITLSSNEVRVETSEEDSPAKEKDSPRAVKFELEPENLSDATSLKFWAALFAAMQIAQWVVVALSRDFHDAIARDASLLTHLEPEDGPLTPRIRLNVRWLLKEARHRWRSFVAILLGTPVLFLLTLPLPMTRTLLAVLVPAWSAYWVVVFTASKSARAWTDTSGRLPWFLRFWTVLTTQVPGFRWKLFQSYARFWTARSRFAFSPAAEVERQPWAFAGLAIVRGLSMLPLLKCFLRPLIPVASAHLLAANQASLAAPSPLLPVTDPDAPSSRPA
ncbi:hypothetical protein [Stigmatella aurantiaca]|uniref:Uncharacterized protein n=1 Tax=Stigmatella aurantiaca (strain DW4/3-1) TaxID=378806 RepID=E3FTR5_STIAD|nr:hypothetical protein [Stigmatella aurantiaca]ADO70867.1 uncharacterized protein STAUR_3075 [Stigmatella aurantiaca DW4/3-1]